MNNIEIKNELLSIFGGSDNCKEDFPETYNAINNDIQVVRYKYNKSKRLCLIQEKNQGHNIEPKILSVGRKKSNPSKIQVVVMGNLLRYNDNLTGYMTVKLCTSQNEYKLGFNSDYIIHTFEFNADDNRTYHILFAYTNQKTDVAMIEFVPYYYNSDIECEFDIKEPVKKKGTITGTDTISVKYNDIDYSFDYSYAGYHKTKIQLPSIGSVKITSGNKISNIVECNLTLTNLSSKQKYKRIEHNSITLPKIESDKVTITWNINELWGDYLATELMQWAAYIYAEYNLSIHALLESGKDIILLITNSENIMEANGVGRVKRIRAFADCLKNGTLVQLADNSTRVIESLCIGDKLKNMDGKEVIIKNITEGTGHGIYKIETDNGLSIEATGEHPILCEEKMVPFRNVTPGMKLNTINGLVNVISNTIYCPENSTCEKIYSIELENDDNQFIANGFIVGDMKAEVQMEEYLSDLRNFIDKRWLKEYDFYYKSDFK